MNHLGGAVPAAQPACHTEILVHRHGSDCGIPGNGIHRADLCTVCIGTLVANCGKMVEIFTGMGNVQQCPVRIASAQQTGAACHLADFTPRA